MIHAMTRRLALYGIAAAMLAGSAWAQGAGSPGKINGTIVLYTPNSAQAAEAVLEVARQNQPALKVSSITGGSAQLLRRIEAEAEKPQADMFWSSSANTLAPAKNFFEAYASPELSAIPAELHYPDNLLTASNLHVVVAMLNKNQLGSASEPKTWADLLDPAFKGKIIIADPTNSSTAYTILWGFEKLMGEEALRKLAKNVVVSSSASTVLRSVGQGEYAVGLTFESNAYAYVAGGQSEISLVYPGEGTFTTPEFQALVKGAPSKETARAAFDFMLSRDVQIALLEAAFRRPSRKDIDVSKYVDLPPLEKIKIFATDEADAAANREAFLKRWQSYVAEAGKAG